jgi:hypothetical protein
MPFTYDSCVIDGSVQFEGAERILPNVRAMGERRTFRIAPEDIGAFVASAALVLRQELGADDDRARYLPAGKF